MIERNIIIDFKTKYLENNKIIHYLNNTDKECLICFNKLDSNALILINNFCECYQIVFLCDKCFLFWYNNDNKCFICHSKYITSNGIKKTIFKFNPTIYNNLKNHFLLQPNDNLFINRHTTRLPITRLDIPPDNIDNEYVEDNISTQPNNSTSRYNNDRIYLFILCCFSISLYFGITYVYKITND